MRVSSRSTFTTLIQVGCVLVIGIIAVAGLWPFHAPRNRVTWLENENGLRFGYHGTAISAGPFRVSHRENQGSCSLEIWLLPERVTDESSILAMDGSVDVRKPFVLRQDAASLAIQRYVVEENGVGRHRWFKIDNVFQEGKSVFVTITSNAYKTSIYLNGAPTATSPAVGMIGSDLTGRLVIANSTVDNSWAGRIMGLALYQKELTSDEVKNHFESWTSKHQPALVGEQLPQAVYLFDEHSGNTVHNQVDSATDLVIPKNYSVLHPAFLNPTWAQYSRRFKFWMHWSVWKDLGMNVAGFIPVGFIFMAYFSSVRQDEHAASKVILLGFLASLTIETLQWFLPTRDSGMTDLLTNTMGTALGVALYRNETLQAHLARVIGRVHGASKASVGVETDDSSEAETQLFRHEAATRIQ
jgi:hypothetical protein